MDVNETLQRLEDNLQKQAELKREEKQLKAALTDEYAESIKEKGFGSFSVDAGEYKLTFNTPKKVEWDQEKLAEIYEKIRAGNDNPADYIEISYSVPESRFKAWPTVISEEFMPARTVKEGAVSIKFERKEA